MSSTLYLMLKVVAATLLTMGSPAAMLVLLAVTCALLAFIAIMLVSTLVLATYAVRTTGVCPLGCLLDRGPERKTSEIRLKV